MSVAWPGYANDAGVLLRRDLEATARMLASISDMKVQAARIAALRPRFKNLPRLYFQSLRIWPKWAKLSRQDATAAIRQVVLTRILSL